VPAEVARHSDWDKIDKSFTAVRVSDTLLGTR